MASVSDVSIGALSMSLFVSTTGPDEVVLFSTLAEQYLAAGGKETSPLYSFLTGTYAVDTDINRAFAQAGGSVSAVSANYYGVAFGIPSDVPAMYFEAAQEYAVRIALAASISS